MLHTNSYILHSMGRKMNTKRQKKRIQGIERRVMHKIQWFEKNTQHSRPTVEFWCECFFLLNVSSNDKSEVFCCCCCYHPRRVSEFVFRIILIWDDRNHSWNVRFKSVDGSFAAYLNMQLRKHKSEILVRSKALLVKTVSNHIPFCLARSINKTFIRLLNKFVLQHEDSIRKQIYNTVLDCVIMWLQHSKWIPFRNWIPCVVLFNSN